MDIIAIFIFLTSLLSTSFASKGGKPIDGIIIGSSEDTGGFPTFDYPTYPPSPKKPNQTQGGDKTGHVTITKQVPYPVPHPVPYPVYEKIPFPVKVPVPVKVDQPYHVKVYKPYPVRVEKPVPYKVIKNVHVPVKVPVNVPVPVKVPVLVPQPYPVKITKNVPVHVPETVYVKKPVLVYIGYNKNEGYIKGEADVTYEDGFDKNAKSDYAVEIDWDGKQDENSQPIEVEVDVTAREKYPQKMYTKVDYNQQQVEESSREKTLHQKNDRVVIFKTELSKAELSKKLLEEKRDYASSEESYEPQNSRINAQLKTISAYATKPEESPRKKVNTKSQATFNNYKDQNQKIFVSQTSNVGPQLFGSGTSQEENGGSTKNEVNAKSIAVNQNGKYIKLVSTSDDYKNGHYLGNKVHHFNGGGFTGLGAYATHSTTTH